MLTNQNHGVFLEFGVLQKGREKIERPFPGESDICVVTIVYLVRGDEQPEDC